MTKAPEGLGIHLQAIGRFLAKPAGELRVGDMTVWNFGSTAEVASIRAQDIEESRH